MSGKETRKLRFDGKNYQVLKHSSSGLGHQFTVQWDNSDGKTEYLYLNSDIVVKNPAHQNLFDACRKLFGLNPTLGNNIRLDGNFYQPKE